MNISDYFINELPPCESEGEDFQEWQEQQQSQLRKENNDE